MLKRYNAAIMHLGLFLWPALVLAVDALTPLGVADGVLYAPAVAATVFMKNRGRTFQFAGICSILTVLGVFLSPDTAVPARAWIVNRVYSIIIIWMIAFFVSRFVRDADRIEQLEQRNMITMSAWTKEVYVDGKWIRIEEFLKQRFGIEVSHGIDPESSRRILEEINEMKTRDGGGETGGSPPG